MSTRSRTLIAFGLLLLTAASLHADGIENNAVTNGVYGGISGGGKFTGSAPPVTDPASVIVIGGFL